MNGQALLNAIARGDITLNEANRMLRGEKVRQAHPIVRFFRRLWREIDPIDVRIS